MLLRFLHKRFKAQEQQEALGQQLTIRKARLAKDLENTAGHKPILATVLGGSGFVLVKDKVVFISRRKDTVAISNPESLQEDTIKFSDIMNIDIFGPGTEHSNAGVVGGGFGVEGALKGILVASAINALMSKSKTNTFLRLSTAKAEIFFHMTTLEPTDLRMILSPAIVQLEARRDRTQAKSMDSVSDEIAKLHRMLQDGVLTAEEFTAAKNRVLRNV